MYVYSIFNYIQEEYLTAHDPCTGARRMLLQWVGTVWSKTTYILQVNYVQALRLNCFHCSDFAFFLKSTFILEIFSLSKKIFSHEWPDDTFFPAPRVFTQLQPAVSQLFISSNRKVRINFKVLVGVESMNNFFQNYWKQRFVGINYARALTSESTLVYRFVRSAPHRSIQVGSEL